MAYIIVDMQSSEMVKNNMTYISWKLLTNILMESTVDTILLSLEFGMGYEGAKEKTVSTMSQDFSLHNKLNRSCL